MSDRNNELFTNWQKTLFITGLLLVVFGWASMSIKMCNADNPDLPEHRIYTKNKNGGWDYYIVPKKTTK